MSKFDDEIIARLMQRTGKTKEEIISLALLSFENDLLAKSVPLQPVQPIQPYQPYQPPIQPEHPFYPTDPFGPIPWITYGNNSQTIDSKQLNLFTNTSASVDLNKVLDTILAIE